MRTVALRSCLAILLILIMGCSARRQPQSPPPTPYDPQEEIEAVIQTEPVLIAQQMEGQTGIVELTVTDRGFEPSVLTTTVGERVKIHVTNKGSREHTLTIPRWGVVTRNLAPGEENYIEFTAGEQGNWPFFSDPTGEVEPGLTGELRVE